MLFRCSLILLLIIPSITWSSSAKYNTAFLQLDHLNRTIHNSLDEIALADFKTVTTRVKNNIFWQQKGRENKYQNAFERSYPFFKNLLRDDVPEYVFLIPFLESGWHATKGSPDSDYGYWQMVNEVVAEIKTLDQASDELRNTHPDKIRSDPELSTEAALIHLKRYYFYFRHVAHFSEADAWLFSVTAFNWGAGNVKTMLFDMQNKPIKGWTNQSKLTFAAFYHYLYESSKRQPNNKSMQVALEYLPNLWNIALLIQSSQKDFVKASFTLNKSSSVSIP